MRIIVLVLLLVFMTSFAFAGSSAEIISIDKDANGNIRVWTQYKIDGKEVESRYPKINGKYVYCTRYQALNFIGMSDAEIKTRILEDVNDHTGTLIRKTFIKKRNDDIIKSNLGEVTGSKITKKSVIIKVDTNGDNVKDEEWTAKTDGSYTTKPILVTP